jgi:glycosyltransferase involved in cell wall biosynthesis
MKNLLYIGNKLSIHGNTATSIETLGSYLENEGYNLTYASSKKNKIFRIIDMIWTTIKESRKTDYVLIDTYSTQNFWYAFIISQLCRILNLRYIVKLHGGNLPDRLDKNPFLSKVLFSNAYLISAPSDYLLNAFSKNFSKNLVYLPNAIEIKKYEFINRVIEVPKILWVRSFSSIYNPIMAIKVLDIIKDKYPLAELSMVGPDKENLIPECKKYAEERNLKVTFTGKLEKKEWHELSKGYNIFINTTHFDNMPVSVIEAMALGLPVISTNVGGIPYAIKHNVNGLLVNDNDAVAMAKEIQKLIENTEIRSNIVTLARLKVEDFDWSRVKKKWHEILR